MIASGNNVAYMGLTSANSLEATGARTPADALGVDPSMSDLEDGSEESDEYECPTCGKPCASLAGRSIHHTHAHGESISGFTYECAWCGDDVTKQQRDGGEEANHFCDKECFGAWHSENMSGGNNPHWKGGLVAVECANCGESKEVKPYVARQEKNHFCDPKCMGEYQTDNWNGENHPAWKSEYVPCGWCGEGVKVKPHRDDLFDLHFCNMQCKGRWQVENLTGENNPYWNGGYEENYGAGWGEKKKQLVRERDGYKCQVCGVHQEEYQRSRAIKLDVHHIIPAANFDDAERRNAVDNLVTLCRSCHRKWEGIPLSPQLED